MGFTTPQVIQIDQSQFTVGGSQVAAAVTWHRRHRVFSKLTSLMQPIKIDWIYLVDDLTLQTLQGWKILPVPRELSPANSPAGSIDVRIQVERPVIEDAPIVANWQGNVAANVRDLQIGRQAFGELALDGQLTPDQWQTKAKGTLLNAALDGDVTLVFDRQPEWNVREVRGDVTWQGGRDWTADQSVAIGRPGIAVARPGKCSQSIQLANGGY